MLRDRSGQVLSAEKQYLAESRLLPVARKHGLAGLAELVDKLKATTAAAPLTVAVIEAMTTNESFFFRDKMPFDHFRAVIMPAFLAARARGQQSRHDDGAEMVERPLVAEEERFVGGHRLD